MIYDKRRDQYILETDTMSARELTELRKQRYKGMRATDIKLRQEYARTHRHGYCPHCHLLLPATGVCDCGYTAK